jgi:2-C-methyl-D-erythritol 4-phosphate cytidylyltransferase/2-C-methyl-D-erythritol 2,4-cyclodiphosphate synthase
MRNFFTQRLILKDITLVVLAAGNSTRFNSNTKKQWLRIGNDPLWLFVTEKLYNRYDFSKVIVVGNNIELDYMANFSDKFTFIAGGKERQDSMSNALDKVDTKYVMITDVARSCVPFDMVDNIIQNKGKADCIVPYLNASDTVIYQNETINRDDVKLIQTPQLSKTKILKEALIQNETFTDDSSAIKNIGGDIFYLKGSIKASKITFGEELKNLSCLSKPSNNIFVGIGYDIHQFEKDKKMYLGGVEIKGVDYGFKAHSDGDVLIHSVIDSILGASGAGDIGEFFPDDDQKYKGIDSKLLLDEIIKFISSVGYEIVNIDITIIAQKPKINPYKTVIKQSLSNIIEIKPQFINIKATTAEKLGFIGRGEGVAVQSVATLKYYDWSKEI